METFAGLTHFVPVLPYVVPCTIWYHLRNLKNVKTPVEECLKVTLLHGYFSRFLNCVNSTKQHKTPHIFQCFPLVCRECYRKLEITEINPQLTFICSKSTIETLQKGVKYVHS